MSNGLSDSSGSTSTYQANGTVRTAELPPRPALLMALQREIRKDDPHLGKVAELIGRDAAMAGKLLETANSAFFSLRRRAATVEDAVALLGLNQCGAIMTGLITRRALASGQMMMARFWDVSEKRARGIGYVARQTRACPAELAHSFGLFCDIGIPLLKARFPGYLETLSIANRTAARKFLEVENARHDTNHSLAGALLTEHWGIAPEVSLAIRIHHAHDALYDDSVPATTRALVACNFIAEKAIQEHRGEPQSLEWNHGGAAAMDMLNLSESDVEDMCAGLKERLSGASSA